MRRVLKYRKQHNYDIARKFFGESFSMEAFRIFATMCEKLKRKRRTK